MRDGGRRRRARGKKKGGETFRSMDLMNLKLRRRLFVGLFFYTACAQGHQTQRNKIPRYVCAAYGRRMNMSFMCIRRPVHRIKALFFISLPRFLSPQTTTAPYYHQPFVKRAIIFRSSLDTAVCVCECKICFNSAILIFI